MSYQYPKSAHTQVNQQFGPQGPRYGQICRIYKNEGPSILNASPRPQLQTSRYQQNSSSTSNLQSQVGQERRSSLIGNPAQNTTILTYNPPKALYPTHLNGLASPAYRNISPEPYLRTARHPLPPPRPIQHHQYIPILAVPPTLNNLVSHPLQMGLASPKPIDKTKGAINIQYNNSTFNTQSTIINSARTLGGNDQQLTERTRGRQILNSPQKTENPQIPLTSRGREVASTLIRLSKVWNPPSKSPLGKLQMKRSNSLSRQRAELIQDDESASLFTLIQGTDRNQIPLSSRRESPITTKFTRGDILQDSKSQEYSNETGNFKENGRRLVQQHHRGSSMAERNETKDTEVLKITIETSGSMKNSVFTEIQNLISNLNKEQQRQVTLKVNQINYPPHCESVGLSEYGRSQTQCETIKTNDSIGQNSSRGHSLAVNHHAEKPLLCPYSKKTYK